MRAKERRFAGGRICESSSIRTISSPRSCASIYLTAANIAVIPDYVMMEVLASRRCGIHLRKWFKILAECPDQARFWKSTHAISGPTCKARRSRGLQKRFIERDQTANFKKFYATLERAVRTATSPPSGSWGVKAAAAAAEIAQLAKGSGRVTLANLAGACQEIHDAELAILTKGKPIRAGVVHKITGEIVALADNMFMAHGYFRKQPPTRTLSNAFIFRYAVAGYVVALRCIKEGGAQGASAKNIAATRSLMR